MNPACARHDHGQSTVALVGWLALVVFIGVLGVCYVHLKQGLAADGNLCRELEISVRELDEKLVAVNSDIRRFTGRPSLERRRQEGFFRMMEISDSRVVRLRPRTESAALPVAAEEVTP